MVGCAASPVLTTKTMRSQIKISGITPEEARAALLDAVNERVLYCCTFWNDGTATARWTSDHANTFMVLIDDFGCLYLDVNTDEINDTAFRVAEGIIRLAAHANRKGGVK